MGGEKGRPPGLGPVFAYEWITASRRWQGYALRSLFVLMLLAAPGLAWVGRTEVTGEPTIKALAAVGRQFFLAVIGTQLTLVLLAAPAGTLGSAPGGRGRARGACPGASGGPGAPALRSLCPGHPTVPVAA